MSDYRTLTYDVDRGVATVTFTTPDSLNSITEKRLAELDRVVGEIETSPSLQAVVWTGTGRAFCVGLDLELLKRAFDEIDYFEDVVRRLNALILRVEAFPIPTIAAVNGFARAGGFELALACDVMIIAEEAKIGDNHTHVGVMPGGGATQRLPRRIGAQRAKELIWTARWLTGAEAVEYGLALRSVPGSELLASVEAFVDTLRNKPRACLAAVKAAMRAGEGLPITEAIEAEIRQFVAYMGGEPFAREGFRASLEGREPDWSGPGGVAAGPSR